MYIRIDILTAEDVNMHRYTSVEVYKHILVYGRRSF
jgi:hypothetical protein